MGAVFEWVDGRVEIRGEVVWLARGAVPERMTLDSTDHECNSQKSGLSCHG